jgi:predicted phosphoribosyltransferase
MIFRDRRHAGRALGRALAHYEGRPDVIVLALPRGGVPVAFEVARALRAPLDVFLVRKLGLPGNEEYAIGAIASGGVRVVDEALLHRFGVPLGAVERVVERQERELRRREHAYRDDLPPVELAGKAVILVDDGLATGSSMRAAVKAVRGRGARRVVVAVPVGPAETVRDLSRLADEAVCLSTPDPFLAVGRFYEDFEQTSDAEVVELLRRAHAGFASDAVGLAR